MSANKINSVLLIGGSGFLGLHLIEQFYRNDSTTKISVFDVRPLPEKLSKQFTFDPKNIKFFRAFVYTSSAGVIFNGQDIHNADETWPIPEVPMDSYNETKAIAEDMVLKANDPSSNFYTIALRPAGIFGPGDRQLVPGLRSVAKLGQSKFQLGDNNN